MKELRKICRAIHWMVHHSRGELMFAVFNVTMASLFVIIFVSIGDNLYDKVVLRYNVNSKYEQLDVVVKAETLSQTENELLTAETEQYRKYYETDDLVEYNDFSLGVYEVSDTLFFDRKADEVYLYLDEERLQRGAIISDDYRKRLGIEMEEVENTSIVILQKNGKTELPIAAVLKEETEDVISNYYKHDVYVSKQTLFNTDELRVKLVSVLIKDEKKYKEQIKNIESYVLNTTEERNEIIRAAKLIRGIVDVFGIMFGCLGGIGLIDAVRNLVNRSKDKIYLMMTMGYENKTIRLFLKYMGGGIGIVGTVLGFGGTALFFECLQSIYGEKAIFGFPLSELIVLRIRMMIPCLIIVELITLTFISISTEKLSSETLIGGLNGME